MSNAPNWVDIGTLILAAATLGVLLWTTFRKPGPIIRARMEHLSGDAYELLIETVPDWRGKMVSMTGNGVLLARAKQGGKSYDPDETWTPLATPSRMLLSDMPLPFRPVETLTYQLLISPLEESRLSRALRASLRRQKASSIKLRIFLTSPRISHATITVPVPKRPMAIARV